MAYAISASCVTVAQAPEETPMFIVIGQSNADGSAEFIPEEDARLRIWYDSDYNPKLMKIWYKSCYIITYPDETNWVHHGPSTDVGSGWMNLWYRNENALGRSARNMAHGWVTWSTFGVVYAV